MVELADTLDLGSSGAIHAGSSPVTRTNRISPLCGGFPHMWGFFFLSVVIIVVII